MNACKYPAFRHTGKPLYRHMFYLNVIIIITRLSGSEPPYIRGDEHRNRNLYVTRHALKDSYWQQGFLRITALQY